MRENIVIVGNGPATYVAAIYASTANLKPLVILHPTNYTHDGPLTIPGIEHKIKYSEYISLLRSQAERFDVKFIDTEVLNIQCDTIHKITTTNNSYITKTVIIEDIELCRKIFSNEMFDNNRVRCEKNSTQCEVPGVYVCGGAKELCDEVIVHGGSGCMAAMDAKEYIENNF